LYYSGKKKRHTLKNVLIVDEFGAIHFLSDTYEGRVHDKSIADEAKYTLPTASLLYQDAGFQKKRRIIGVYHRFACTLDFIKV